MKKQWICALALLCCLVLTGCGREAAGEMALSEAEAQTEIVNIYLTMQLGLDGDAAALGAELAVFTLTEAGLDAAAYEMYPVFYERKVVALATGHSDDEGVHLTGCGENFAAALQKELADNPGEPVAIVYAREGVYLVREGEEPVLLREMPQAGRASIGELEGFRDSLTYAAVRPE